MNVTFLDENVIVVDDVRLAARYALYDEESAGYYAHLPMENRAALILWVPDDASNQELGPASVRLVLAAHDDPIEDLNLEATIDAGAIRLTRWAREFARGAYKPDDHLPAVIDSIKDMQWSCDVDEVSEVQDYLQRWGRLPVRAW